MRLTDNEKNLLIGAINQICLDMNTDWEEPTYWDDGDPSNNAFDGDGWNVADDKRDRNGTKVIKLLKRILEESK